ncbi:hypothetical protein MmiEs2_05780 [Methanimicrococcus stummii]|uniref:Uncharacterized protein n=1 Tax=Methanimicrococcus stummii TaxID=3028294 RepID=A0AA96V8W6_9EURY|nr:hypothetical protein MmiEs2_05780 [Methanimicrococcus sp. Es2]
MRNKKRDENSFPTGDKTATGTDYSKMSPLVRIQNPSLLSLLFSKNRK